MRIKYNFLKLKSRGDTIVEVLLSIAVLSLVLTISYGLANTSAQTNIQARERSEAQKLTEQQLELLRGYVSPDQPWEPTFVCFQEADGAVTTNLADCSAGTDGRYQSIITTEGDENTGVVYIVTTTWNNVKGGTDEQKLSYKISSTGDIGQTTAGSLPSTPECSDGVDNDGDGLNNFPADPGCSSAGDNSEVDLPVDIAWSYSGNSVPGRPFCTRVHEPVEPGASGWGDNYVCSAKNYSFYWEVVFTNPAIDIDGTPYGGTGPLCTYFDNDNIRPSGAREGESDAVGGHAWEDNYLCSNVELGLEFRHSINPDSRKKCIIINEPSEANVWPSAPSGGNNPAYLCYFKFEP